MLLVEITDRVELVVGRDRRTNRVDANRPPQIRANLLDRVEIGNGEFVPVYRLGRDFQQLVSYRRSDTNCVDDNSVILLVALKSISGLYKSHIHESRYWTIIHFSFSGKFSTNGFFKKFDIGEKFLHISSYLYIARFAAFLRILTWNSDVVLRPSVG